MSAEERKMFKQRVLKVPYTTRINTNLLHRMYVCYYTEVCGRNWNKDDEEMWQKLQRKVRFCQTNSKSKWRQSPRCNQNRSSEVGHRQYWIFIKHVSIL